MGKIYEATQLISSPSALANPFVKIGVWGWNKSLVLFCVKRKDKEEQHLFIHSILSFIYSTIFHPTPTSKCQAGSVCWWCKDAPSAEHVCFTISPTQSLSSRSSATFLGALTQKMCAKGQRETKRMKWSNLLTVDTPLPVKAAKLDLEKEEE